MEQMVVRGSVAEVRYDPPAIRVRYGPDSVSDWIEWKPQRSGLVTVWSPPQIGEGATIISNGDINQGEVFLGSYHKGMPAPSMNGDETVTQYPDGTVVRYNFATHKLDVVVNGDASVSVSGSASVSVGENLKASAGGSAEIGCDGVLTLSGKAGVKMSGASFAWSKT
ncbi:MAG: phage baseplate assembly protein V [Aeromonas sp.]